jgi:hypothetical protein
VFKFQNWPTLRRPIITPLPRPILKSERPTPKLERDPRALRPQNRDAPDTDFEVRRLSDGHADLGPTKTLIAVCRSGVTAGGGVRFPRRLL